MKNRSRHQVISARIPAYTRALLEILREDREMSTSRIIDLAFDAISTPEQKMRARKIACEIDARETAKALASKFSTETLENALRIKGGD